MDSSVRDKYQAVIGLEVHVQLLTKSKIFNSDSTAFGSPPNSQTGTISLGHPGTLPKLNVAALECAVKMGFACHCEITRKMVFDRKNYFYPDLPKGYQITQERTPVCLGGYVTIASENNPGKKIHLHRIHVEEDAGKSIHVEGKDDTLVDFNRAGVALIEIVTLPEIKTAQDAGAFVAEIRKLVRYLDICDGNMEEGSLRCDANVSVMPKGGTKFGSKVEVKNMNSIRNVQRAIDHEIDRQITEIEAGHLVPSETRIFDADTGKTSSMRAKEELNDYRYFPDPDLSPLSISDEWLHALKASMPSLPDELYRRFISDYQLSEYNARVLTDSKDVAAYFEEICRHTANYKAASNWMMGPVKAKLNELQVEKISVPPKTLAALIDLVEAGLLSFSAASQRIFSELQNHPEKDPRQIATELNLFSDNNEQTLLPLINEIMKEFPLKVEEYRNGKQGIITMFMGEVMKRSRGKADPKKANELLVNKLSEK